MARIRRFKKEKFPQVLVSVNMLDTGFDCPEVVNLIFARYTKSVIALSADAGRGTRKAQGKPIFTLFDFVGVATVHEGDEGYGEGGKVMERQTIARTTRPRTLVTVESGRRHRPDHARLGDDGRCWQFRLSRSLGRKSQRTWRAFRGLAGRVANSRRHRSAGCTMLERKSAKTPSSSTTSRLDHLEVSAVQPARRQAPRSRTLRRRGNPSTLIARPVAIRLSGPVAEGSAPGHPHH